MGPWSAAGKAIGWTSESPLSSDGAATLVSDYPELSDCVALSEPSALLRSDGVIDLAVGCASNESGEVTIRIELLRSFDSARTFRHAGTLLTGNDARCVGASEPEFNAAHLFTVGERNYLLATPAGPVSGIANGYRGCYLFELSGTTAVMRDTSGRPIVERVIDASGSRFVGACAYAEGASAIGYWVPELVLEEPPRVFRIFRSRIQAP